MSRHLFVRQFSVALLSIIGLCLHAATAGAADVTLYALIKGQTYSQTNTSTPVLSADIPFTFTSIVVPTASNSVNSATVKPPGKPAASLTNVPPTFLFVSNFLSQAALDAAFPSGTYTFSFATRNEGNQNANINLPSASYPNRPTISNFNAAQAINPTNSFTLQWQAFTGGTANDSIQLLVFDADGVLVFSTPYYGETGALNGTATTAAIPANTLSAEIPYIGTLIFSKLASINPPMPFPLNQSGYPNVTGAAAYSSQTVFPMRTLFTPRLLISKQPAPGQDLLRFEANPGRTYEVHCSTNFSNWVTLLTTNAAGTWVSIPLNTTSPVRNFYRVRRQ